MARPLRLEFPGALYHVTSRGNERYPTFCDDRDRLAFLDFLGEAVRRFGWIVTAYVLMTNHFHLVIQTPEANLGQPDLAVPEFEAAFQLLNTRPQALLGPLGLAYGLAGRRAEARTILAELEQASQKRYVSPYSLAMVYSGLGRMDEAFAQLDRALEQRTPCLIVCTPNDPSSVALRRDPRWKGFIDRLRKQVRCRQEAPIRTRSGRTLDDVLLFFTPEDRRSDSL